MLNPDKSNDPGIGAFIRENGRTAQHGAPRELSSARHSGSMPRAVANRSPALMYRSGFSVPVTRSVPSPSRPTEVRPRHSSSSSAIRRRMAVVFPAFLHSPITVTGDASPTRGARSFFKKCTSIAQEILRRSPAWRAMPAEIRIAAVAESDPDGSKGPFDPSAVDSTESIIEAFGRFCQWGVAFPPGAPRKQQSRGPFRPPALALHLFREVDERIQLLGVQRL